MSATALALILAAAVAHATWNLFSKQAAAAGASSFVWLMSLTATAAYAPVVLVSVLADPPRLTALAWVFMLGTGLLQAGYFLFLQSGYRLGDLSVVYPVGRGSGALLAALAGIVLLGEHPGAAGLAGIGLVVAGVLLLGAPAGRGRPAGHPAPRALAFALATGLFIASYTLWDKYAVSTLRVPPLLQGYASLPVMALVLAPFALRQRARTALVWRSWRRQVAGAAVLSPLAYVLVLIALSFTAVSAVAPAREVSVLAGVLLGRRMLGEGQLARRLTAAGAIAAGIICIAVG
ncbi:MAG TPA: DMT family transporter [Streptosporangiaceae bacterium]|nr:DMT family transporter [Streptosporangiaceae bacterium]